MNSTPRGELVSRALTHSWRPQVPETSSLSPDELKAVTPLLYESGAAGLGWWRIRNTALRKTAEGELLHQAFRLLVLRAKAHETQIEKLFRLFREREVEALLVKGWAVARYYPEPALRPYGDIDLLIHPSDFDRAARVLQSDEARDCQTDAHVWMFELADRPIEDVFARSRLVHCAGEQVRVLSDEDHFALLSIHLLKHAAWRPLWLCDIAMLLETMAEGFDWEICFGRDKRRLNWILAVVGLAQKLLGAEIPHAGIAELAKQPPDWLSTQVLRNWEIPFAHLHAPLTHNAPIRSYLRRPRGLLKDLARRWPDPILATVTANGTFGKRPRIRYQFGNWVIRAARLAQTGGVG